MFVLQQQQLVLLQTRVGMGHSAAGLLQQLPLLTAAAAAAAAGVLGLLLLPGRSAACHLQVQRRVRPCVWLSRALDSVLLQLLLLVLVLVLVLPAVSVAFLSLAL
jgi:hypothetical protein